MGFVLKGFQKVHPALPYLADEATAVLLDVALIEAVALTALGVAVLLGETETHVLTINVVAAVGLLDWEDTVAGYTAKGTAFVGLRIACTDKEGEGGVGLAQG